MKKTVRLLSVLLVVAMLAISLASCTVLTGKYSANVDLGLYEANTTYEFGIFGKVTRTTVSEVIFGDPETVVTEGKYEISENPENAEELVITLTFGDESTTSSFVQGEENGVKYIKIGGIQYNKE